MSCDKQIFPIVSNTASYLWNEAFFLNKFNREKLLDREIYTMKTGSYGRNTKQDKYIISQINGIMLVKMIY